MRFEEAAVYRDYITAAESISEKQRVTMISGRDLDVVLTVKDDKNSFVVLFTVRDGKLSGRETFQVQASDGDDRGEITAEFIKQYYSQWAQVPPEILVETELPENELLEEFLSRDGRKVRIFVPQKGDKRNLLRLAQSDVTEMVKTLADKAQANYEKERALSEEVAWTLREGGFSCGEGPYRIESYDISNTNGVDSVGAMVVFEGTRKVRKDYRRFKIKTVEGPDDYGSLQEMLYRRFKRAKEGDPAFAVLPDAIFMDGGQGQVTAAEKVLAAMKLDIPVAGMAKDDSHRTRAIVFADGREIDLRQHPVLFKYCGTIQEEVHRFAIEYHRNLRNKNSIHSVLDSIQGVGPTRRNALLNHFKTVEAIKKATTAELAEVPGITEAVAENIVKFFGK